MQQLTELGIAEADTNKILDFVAQGQYLGVTRRSSKASELVNAIIKIAQASSCTSEQITEKVDSFCRRLKSNKDFLKQMTEFDRRVLYARSFMTQREKEVIKRKLTDFVPPSDQRYLGDDPQFRLLEEIRQRFGFRDFEPGYVSSPLALLNIVQGKHDEESSEAHYRTKLFFVYGSKNIINEISRSSELVEKLNEKIKEKYRSKNQEKLWQINSELIDHFRSRSKQEPVYQLGSYGSENNKGKKIRHWCSPEEYQKKKAADPNSTFAEAERIALKQNATQQELSQRFRIKLTNSEEISFFGTSSPIEEQENNAKETAKQEYLKQPKKAVLAKPSVEKPDSSFNESFLDYQKKTKQIHWAAGSYFFQLHDKLEGRSDYFDAVEDLGLSQCAGISGSSEQTLTIAGIVGINSKEELMNLRLLYLPWMCNHDDHSSHEILMAFKTFGLEYTASPDYYKQLYPESKVLVDEIRKTHKERGFELPDHYLSNEYAQEVRDQILEDQDQHVKELQKSNHLFLMGTRTYRHNYSIDDLFGDKKIKNATDFLTDKRVGQIVEARREKRLKKPQSNPKELLYKVNPKTQTLEPYTMPKEPFYKGTKKQSLTLVPPSGKVIPYVPFDYPHLNRVGLLFDVNQSQVKKDSCVFSADANVDIEQKWKKKYTRKETMTPDFAQKLKKDSEEAVKFNKEKAHQTTWDELTHDFEAHTDEFIPYNEINASINNKGIVGIYTFSRGLPTHTNKKIPYKDQHEKFEWAPLHHESKTEFVPDADYDRYMRLMGIGKQFAIREKFGIDVPLYQINATTNTGLTLISREEQIREINDTLANQHGELEGLIRIIKHQSNIKDSEKTIKNALIKQLKSYLQKL